MSKTLILMRHGAYQTGAPQRVRPGRARAPDPSPLSPEGRAQAQSIGEQLRDAGYAPDRILYSPYTRTRQTAGGVAAAFRAVAAQEAQWLAEHDYSEPRHVRSLPDDAGTVVLVTHAGNVGALARAFGAVGARASFRHAETLVLESDAQSWADFTRARLVRTLFPK